MKNQIIYILLFLCYNAFSQTRKIEFDKKEKYEAINSFIQTMIKEKYQEIIIVEDKISPNEALRIFKGNTIKDNLGNFVEQDGGIEKPLFNKKYFQIMEKKYYTNSLGKRKQFTTTSWQKEDFKHHKITLENFEDVYLKLQNGTYFEKKTEIQIFALSEPIYYKNKNYLVIGVQPSSTRLIGFKTSYIIIMKKINKKWVIIDKALDYIMD